MATSLPGWSTLASNSGIANQKYESKARHWGNANLLPDIEVNTDAMARTTQLVQEGFVKITE